jgi:hypothetical protein
MSEKEAVLVPFRKAIRRKGFDWYFPIPVFVGDGEEWSQYIGGSILGEGTWLWLRDMRDPLTYVGKKDWQVVLNPGFPIRFRLYPGDEILMRHVHHVRIKTLNEQKVAMLLIDQPFTFHGQIEEGTPIEESVSVNSEREAEDIVRSLENLLFIRHSDGKIISASEYAL